MQHIAIVYHSAHGHTAHIAHHVLDGARAVPGVLAELVRAEDLARRRAMGRPPMRLSPATPKPPACSVSTLPRRCNAWAVWVVQPHARLAKRSQHDPARYGPVLFSLILSAPVQYLFGVPKRY